MGIFFLDEHSNVIALKNSTLLTTLRPAPIHYHIEIYCILFKIIRKYVEINCCHMATPYHRGLTSIKGGVCNFSKPL